MLGVILLFRNKYEKDFLTGTDLRIAIVISKCMKFHIHWLLTHVANNVAYLYGQSALGNW